MQLRDGVKSHVDVRRGGFFRRASYFEKVDLEKHCFSKRLCLLNCSVTVVLFEDYYLDFASGSLRALLPCQRKTLRLCPSLQLHFLPFTHENSH
ncbi:hypothetical protein PDJAM_G00159570, partial [Pangasius djambal]|nr:hypothetical protein [Pangasius djambal]